MLSPRRNVDCNQRERAMSSINITDPQWRRIYTFLKAHPSVYTGKQSACRQFVEGVHWILRSSAQWRELPERYGKWNSVYKRFARWEEKGIWSAMHQAFATDPDMENAFLDSTVVRAHMCAAGGSKKTVGKPSKHWAAVEADSAPSSIFLLKAWAMGFGSS
jgi:transposase